MGVKSMRLRWGVVMVLASGMVVVIGCGSGVFGGETTRGRGVKGGE